MEQIHHHYKLEIGDANADFKKALLNRIDLNNHLTTNRCDGKFVRLMITHHERQKQTSFSAKEPNKNKDERGKTYERGKLQ